MPAKGTSPRLAAVFGTRSGAPNGKESYKPENGRKPALDAELSNP
jgi:hypothetical protein